MKKRHQQATRSKTRPEQNRRDKKKTIELEVLNPKSEKNGRYDMELKTENWNVHTVTMQQNTKKNNNILLTK